MPRIHGFYHQARIAWLAEQEALSRIRLPSTPYVQEENRAPSFANESALQDADAVALEPV
jgi:hypothetical protein